MTLAHTNGSGDSGGNGLGRPQVTLPAPVWPGRTPRRADWLVSQLPVGMVDDDFFYRFVSLFQEQASTLLDGVDNLEHVIDPAVAPLPMLRFLAGWLGLPPLGATAGEAAYRKLVLRASHLRWWRGTRAGLEELLELYTGQSVEVDEEGRAGPLEHDEVTGSRVSVRLPSTGNMSEEALLRLVLDEVPAHVNLEVVVGERKIWPAPSPERDADGC